MIGAIVINNIVDNLIVLNEEQVDELSAMSWVIHCYCLLYITLI